MSKGSHGKIVLSMLIGSLSHTLGYYKNSVHSPLPLPFIFQ